MFQVALIGDGPAGQSWLWFAQEPGKLAAATP
jgi:hypothetical protein